MPRTSKIWDHFTMYVLGITLGQSVIFAVRYYLEEEKQHRLVTQAISKTTSRAVMEFNLPGIWDDWKRGQCSNEKSWRGTTCSRPVNIAKREKSPPNAAYDDGRQNDQVATKWSTNNRGQFEACGNGSIGFATLCNNFQCELSEILSLTLAQIYVTFEQAH